MRDGRNAAVFISHASADDEFVKQLRESLEAHHIPVWVDSRGLRGGSKLAPEIAQAIGNARHFIAVLGPETVNSRWVRREIERGLLVEKRRKADGYRVIPLLLPGLEPAALEAWFDEEPTGISVGTGPDGLSAAMPDILAALGERLPTGSQMAAQADGKPLAELVLTLADAKIETQEGKRRASAVAMLTYEPADSAVKGIESRRFAFTAPLGPIEADDLRWYLEQYFLWPVGVFENPR